METTMTREHVQCYNFDWVLQELQSGKWQATLRHRWRDGTVLQIAEESFQKACEKLHLLDLQRGLLLGLSPPKESDSLELYDAIQLFLQHLARNPNEDLHRDLRWYRESLYFLGLHAAMLQVTMVSEVNADFIFRYEQSLNPEARTSKDFLDRKEVIKELLDFSSL